MKWLKTQAGRLWAWFCEDWKRFLIVPAVVAGLVCFVRLVRGGSAPSSDPPPPAGTMTPEQGETAIAEIDSEAESAKAEIDRETEAEVKEVNDWLK